MLVLSTNTLGVCARTLAAGTLLALLTACADSGTGSPDKIASDKASDARVVVATYDTGTNPFHPCFRRPSGPSAFDAIPEIRGVAEPLRLTFEDDYQSSLAASQAALAEMLPFTLYAIEGTNLLVYTGANGAADLIDNDPHGAQASSQITCAEYGMAPEGFLVIVNWYYNSGAAQLAIERWSAEQPWIDVIHLNIQRITPMPYTPATGYTVDAIQAMVNAGKLVVIAAGNGFGNAGGHIPTETVDYYSVAGVFVAGANDGTGYASFSNLDPHTVMDGCNTVAAAPYDFGSTTFAGTSSSSPRTSGYVAELLRRLRAHFGADAGTEGSVLVRLPLEQRPASGPLADGTLSVPELHEVLRKTADATLAASEWDGEDCLGYWIPRPVDPQGHDYHRVGYGKLGEHTIDHALEVLLGNEPMPERPTEDRYYDLSNALRDLPL